MKITLLHYSAPPLVGGVESVIGHHARLMVQAGREDRERDQHEHARDQRVPDEDRHPEHRHAGRAHREDRGDEVDGTEDRAETGHPQPHDPEVTPDAG